jgi:hypothetical protein
MKEVLIAVFATLRAGLRSRVALQLEVLALRHQLAVYQRCSARVRTRVAGRLLWAWLSRAWAGWRDVLVFVRPSTVIAWQRRRFREHWARLSHGRPGRPAVAKSIKDLIRKMSGANPGWGSPRIVGELAKLGIHVAKSNLEKYMVRPKKPPSPTWRAFLDNHVKDLVSVDFSCTSGAGSCTSTSRSTRRRSGPPSSSSRRFHGERHRGTYSGTATACTERPFEREWSAWASRKCSRLHGVPSRIPTSSG